MATDLRALLHAVVNPSSNEQYVRDQQTLSNLFKEPEFFIALQGLAADRSLTQQERLMASVITARELKTKWRSKALVPEARKPEVRQTIFSFIEEPDLAIARPQLGLLVAVARIEYPKAWPNLPQLLLDPLITCLSHLESPSSSSSMTNVVLINTLWTINALVKEWRTVKLTQAVAVMQNLEQAFTAPCRKVLEIWAAAEQSGQLDWSLAEAGRYAFKTLARFCQWHWSKAKNLQPEESKQSIAGLVHHTVQYAPLIQAHRVRAISSPESAKLLKPLTKHLRAIGKWWRVMLAIDPKGFCQVPGVPQGVGWWWGEVGGVVAQADGAVANDDSDTVPYPKRILLLGLLLFKDILPILAFDHPDSRLRMAWHELISVFTPNFILSAFHLLLDKLLPLTSTDLEALEEDPEEWLVGESVDSEAWAFEFRPCAERVLIALNNACRNIPRESKVIEPEMLKILANIESTPPNDLVTILRREAVYCALGRLSRAMATYGGVNFEHLLSGVGSWIGQGLPLHRIVKRRVAWLVGEWVGAEEECAKLPLVWQMLLHLLSERGDSSDSAVHLTAAIAIKECVDLWELPIDYFLPFLEQTVHELVKLLGESSTLDGKRYVNGTVGVVIERVGDKIIPFLPALASAVPGLCVWYGGRMAVQSVARGAHDKAGLGELLPSYLADSTKAAKETSGNLMELVLPLIEESLQMPAKDFFEEDGLALWQAGLYNAASPYEPTKETGLFRLVPGLLGMIAENMDLLPILLPLLDSYLLLDAAGLVQTYGLAVCSALSKALIASKVNVNICPRILATVSLLVRTAPIQQLAPIFLQTGLYQYICTSLEDDKASGIILAAYLEILSRIAMIDANVFLQMVVESARLQGKNEEKLLEEILDALWRNFDYVGETRMRKAVAMGAGALLTTGNHHVLDRLDGEFMNIFLDVLGELQQDDPTASITLRSWKEEHSTQWTEIQDTPEGARRCQLEDNDPAYSVPLRGYIIDVLTRAQSVGLGPYWEKADQGTKKSLEKFLA